MSKRRFRKELNHLMKTGDWAPEINGTFGWRLEALSSDPVKICRSGHDEVTLFVGGEFIGTFGENNKPRVFKFFRQHANAVHQEYNQNKMARAVAALTASRPTESGE